MAPKNTNESIVSVNLRSDAVSTDGKSSKRGREQLHEQVDARIGQLERELGELDGHYDDERAQAIFVAMEAARESLLKGWDALGELEADQLARWLSTTEDLRVTSEGMPAAGQE